MNLRQSKYYSSTFYKVIFLILIYAVASFGSPLSAQNSWEQGHFPVTNYSHEESPGHYQNWFITQDKKGYMYTGNGNGILEFDGEQWRLIKSPGLQAVRTVIVDKNNTKWVGADRELGYLEPDSLGFLQFKSLKNKVPDSHELTANIWQIFEEEERILFAADNAIYSWKDDQFTVIPHPGPIYREYQVHGKIYFSISKKGMYQVVNDSLELIPDGAFFKDFGAVVALPYSEDTVLFATRSAGMYIYDGMKVTKFENEVEDYLEENLLYAGSQLPDSSLAFTTLKAGVVIIDKAGKLLKKITVEDGILNSQVHGLKVDRQKALWMALQTGISKVEPHLPYRFFGKRLGLEGTVSAITRHNGNLYVGTYNGLYTLDGNAESGPAKFRKIDGIKSGCFSLLSTGTDLLAATADGVYQLSKDRVLEIYRKGGTRTLFRSIRDLNRIYVGHMHGLSTINFESGEWRIESEFEQVKEDIFSITGDERGTIWLGTSLHKVLKLDFSETGKQTEPFDFNRIKIEEYFEGLPEGSTNLWLIDNEIFVTTDGTGGPLFKFDSSSKKFFPEEEFSNRFGLDSLYTYPIAYQNNGRYILLESKPIEGKQYRFSVTKNNDGDYFIKRIYDERFRSTTENKLFWDNKNLLWLGGEQITRYNFNSEYSFDSYFETFIRKFTVGQDSVIYGGESLDYESPSLAYTNKELRLEYAASDFLGPNSLRYQYRLIGLGSDWSEWTKETRKDYTNLPEGEYQFAVRAQNAYGYKSKVGRFGFVIRAPWYRTWWAYLLYLILFIAFLSAILKWRSRQLKAKNEALERLVEVRTSEVRHQASQLKIQAEKLKELDKAKSRFFANISHEFRTPLTLIKGPIEQLEQNFDEKMNLKTVKMIRRNANRVLNMVNQLLDLSKFDEGSLKLTPTEGDVFKCIRAATSSFNSHAAQRDIDYKVQIAQEVLWASFDRGKLENIIYNLLGNAFKFSGDGSEISFIASFETHGLQILVSDSGKGIPEEKLPYIFDRFYQVDDSNTREKSGSGIGLSLSKDLVELMDGTITVTSEVNKGTFFTVQLPIQKIMMGYKEAIEDTSESKVHTLKKTFVLSKTDDRNLPTVLLVEDNTDMRHFIKEQLIKYYRVNEAGNGAEGLKMARANPSDLIITDLMMPKMDGIELCKKLKTDVHISHIPVIMLTAKAGMENKIEGLETGADDYLTKPFDAKELLVRAKNLIEQRQRLRELYGNKEIQVDPKKITVTPIDQKFLEGLLSLLEEHHSDADFGVPQMQDALAMSKTQLHRKLKALTNEAPGELLRNFRLKRAAQLLSQKADSVTQIAYRVGFNNLSYFAKCFKELYGVAPSSY